MRLQVLLQLTWTFECACWRLTPSRITYSLMNWNLPLSRSSSRSLTKVMGGPDVIDITVDFVISLICSLGCISSSCSNGIVVAGISSPQSSFTFRRFTFFTFGCSLCILFWRSSSLAVPYIAENPVVPKYRSTDSARSLTIATLFFMSRKRLCFLAWFSSWFIKGSLDLCSFRGITTLICDLNGVWSLRWASLLGVLVRDGKLTALTAWRCVTKRSGTLTSLWDCRWPPGALYTWGRSSFVVEALEGREEDENMALTLSLSLWSYDGCFWWPDLCKIWVDFLAVPVGGELASTANFMGVVWGRRKSCKTSSDSEFVVVAKLFLEFSVFWDDWSTVKGELGRFHWDVFVLWLM